MAKTNAMEQCKETDPRFIQKLPPVYKHGVIILERVSAYGNGANGELGKLSKVSDADALAVPANVDGKTVI